MADPADYMQATDSFTTELDGQVVTVNRGEFVRAGHALVKQNPGRFRPLEITSRFDTVEQATAAPGERRNTGRPRQRAGRQQ